MSGRRRREREPNAADRTVAPASVDTATERARVNEYVRRVCETKGESAEPVLDGTEYVRYLTVGRHKRAPVARRRSGDGFDEVF